MNEKTDLLRRTEIEGMMLCGYCEGAEIEVTSQYRLQCANGEVWHLRTAEDEMMGTINPGNALTCVEINQQLRRLISKWEQQNGYESELSAESRS